MRRRKDGFLPEFSVYIHGCRELFVTEDFLHALDRYTAFKGDRGKAVTELMRRACHAGICLKVLIQRSIPAVRERRVSVRVGEDIAVSAPLLDR